MTVPSRLFADTPALGATVRQVLDTLKGRIVAGEYPLDTRLPSERQLAQDMGVARNTVREALDILEGQGMIRRRAGAGTFVAHDPAGSKASTAPVAAETGPLQLQVMRGILEPEMVRLAIVAMPPRRIEALGAALGRMEEASGDVAAFLRLEEEFHRLIAEATGNPLLIACYALVIEARRQEFRTALYRRRLGPARIAACLRRTRALFDAIAARDIETGCELMRLGLVEDQKILLGEDD